MKVRIRVTTFQDTRTDELRRHSDNVEEGRWRARVWLNEKRRTVEPRRSVPLVGWMGAVGPERQGDPRATTTDGLPGIREACSAPFTVLSV